MWNWRAKLIERLAACGCAAGSWSYQESGTPSSEPTALACMALHAADAAHEQIAAGLEWLADIQLPDGSIPVSKELAAVRWPTALGLLAWLRCASGTDADYADQIRKASRYLLNARGVTLDRTEMFEHDTTLCGWSWIPDTYSWVEPTAYAVLALRLAGFGEHPRVREGVRLLLNRALPEGGWNYGNRRVYGNLLRPFPAATGLALVALAGASDDPAVVKSCEYLKSELPRIRAPWSLGWGLLGLGAWGACPGEAEGWLRECAEALLKRSASPQYDAVVLLASAERAPLAYSAAERRDG